MSTYLPLSVMDWLAMLDIECHLQSTWIIETTNLMHACYHRELSILISSRLLHNNSWTTQNLRCKPGFCLYKWGNLHFFSFIRSHLLKEQKGGLLRVYVHSRDSGSDLTPILLDLSKSGPKSVPVVLDVSLYTLNFFFRHVQNKILALGSIGKNITYLGVAWWFGKSWSI